MVPDFDALPDDVLAIMECGQEPVPTHTRAPAVVIS